MDAARNRSVGVSADQMDDPGHPVDVEQLARSVLEASSQQRDPSVLESVPVPILEVIVLFLAALDAQTLPPPTQELVVRALRACSGASRETPVQIIRAVAPLILAASPTLRQSAASCVLHCTSNSSITSLVATFPATLAILSRVLVSPPLPPPPLRLVSTCLRILNATISRLPSLSKDATSTLVQILGGWVYHREVPLGRPVPPERGRPTVAAVGGVMGAFMPPTSGRRKPKETGYISRSSSMSSLAGASSESEADDRAEKSPRFTSMQVRLDALSCLRSLALNNSKALYGDWSLFLADSPYARSRNTLVTLVETDPAVAVRLRACQALEAILSGSSAYLAIAEDRPTKASFTSLSSKLGDVVSELHSSVLALISSSATASNPLLHIAVLRLARILGETAPYARMRRPLAPPLAKGIAPLIRLEDEAVATAATAALSAILKNVAGQAGPQQFDASHIAATALEVLQLPRTEALACELWELLANTRGVDLTPVLVLLHSGLRISTTPVQEAQMAFIATVFNSASPALPLAPYATTLVQIVRVALQSPRPNLRVLACGVLGTPSLETLTTDSSINSLVEGVRLAADEEATVRSAACRMLGLLVKSPSFVAKNGNLSAVLEVLAPRCAEAEPVKSAASWALANCLDIVSMSDLSNLDEEALVAHALELVAATNGEKAGSPLTAVRTNGLRALGSLIKFPTALADDTVASVFQALADCVANGPVKVRWNAAAASANAFSGERLSASRVAPPNLAPILLALSSTLETCSNYKVRIQATTALSALQSRAAFGSTFGVVQSRVRNARARARAEEVANGEILREEQDHFRSLLLKLDRCSQHLDTLKLVRL